VAHGGAQPRVGRFGVQRKAECRCLLRDLVGAGSTGNQKGATTPSSVSDAGIRSLRSETGLARGNSTGHIREGRKPEGDGDHQSPCLKKLLGSGQERGARGGNGSTSPSAWRPARDWRRHSESSPHSMLRAPSLMAGGTGKATRSCATLKPRRKKRGQRGRFLRGGPGDSTAGGGFRSEARVREPRGIRSVAKGTSTAANPGGPWRIAPGVR